MALIVSNELEMLNVLPLGSNPENDSRLVTQRSANWTQSQPTSPEQPFNYLTRYNNANLKSWRTKVDDLVASGNNPYPGFTDANIAI